MGKIVDLMQYKATRKEKAREGIYMEVVPPIIHISYYQNGVVVKRDLVVSEAMLRDLLDQMQ